MGRNAKIRYVERHYGEGDGNGRNVMNPTTVVEIEEGGYMEMETVQIEGVDSTSRVTRATLGAVSYTHLDVYKRQAYCGGSGREKHDYES